ncbi:hypothetical protein LCGC14_1549670, partial [marine sediment metagenome]
MAKSALQLFAEEQGIEVQQPRSPLAQFAREEDISVPEPVTPLAQFAAEENIQAPRPLTEGERLFQPAAPLTPEEFLAQRTQQFAFNVQQEEEIEQRAQALARDPIYGIQTAVAESLDNIIFGLGKHAGRLGEITVGPIWERLGLTKTPPAVQARFEEIRAEERKDWILPPAVEAAPALAIDLTNFYVEIASTGAFLRWLGLTPAAAITGVGLKSQLARQVPALATVFGARRAIKGLATGESPGEATVRALPEAAVGIVIGVAGATASALGPKVVKYLRHLKEQSRLRYHRTVGGTLRKIGRTEEGIKHLRAAKGRDYESAFTRSIAEQKIRPKSKPTTKIAKIPRKLSRRQLELQAQGKTSVEARQIELAEQRVIEQQRGVEAGRARFEAQRAALRVKPAPAAIARGKAKATPLVKEEVYKSVWDKATPKAKQSLVLATGNWTKKSGELSKWGLAVAQRQWQDLFPGAHKFLREAMRANFPETLAPTAPTEATTPISRTIREEIRIPENPLAELTTDAPKNYADSVRQLGLMRDRQRAAFESGAHQTAEKWRKTIPKEKLEDLRVLAEKGQRNLRTGKTRVQIQADLTAQDKAVLSQYREKQEQARLAVNEYLQGSGIDEYIKFLKDYFPHFYERLDRIASDNIAKWAKSSPSAKQRKLPTLEDAVDLG